MVLPLPSQSSEVNYVITQNLRTPFNVQGTGSQICLDESHAKI
jgi:hypothetical protein